MLNENLITDLVTRGVVSDTFRRLIPDKKEQVYQTAIRLFGEYGYDGLAVDHFCREAGISKGSFFQYFPSKSHLLEFTILVFDDYMARWLADIKARESVALVKDRLIYLYRSIVTDTAMLRAEQRFYLFVTNALNHAGVAIEGIELERHFRDYVAEIVRRGEETGEIRGDFEPDLTAYLVTIIVTGIVERQFSRQRLPSARVEEYLVSFLFDGIKA